MDVCVRRNAMLVLGLLPLVGCASMPTAARKMTMEESLVFHPRPFSEADRQHGDEEFEDAWFTAPDGVRLHGWFAPSPRPVAVVLYSHGNGGNIGSLRRVVRLFRDRLNASILVFDYRGYGQSEGTPSETGVLADARAARAWLAARAGVSERDNVLAGKSLGGAVAVDLAARDGARGLILENTFTSLPDVAARHMKWLPAHWLMRMRFDSLAKIGDYHGPLLQVHGDADRVVPHDLGLRLFAAANEPKQFVSIAEGGHNDPPESEYVQALEQFIEALPI